MTINLWFARALSKGSGAFKKELGASALLGVEITSARFRVGPLTRGLRFETSLDISFTDLTTMIVAQDLEVLDILSGDRHFLQVGLGFPPSFHRLQNGRHAGSQPGLESRRVDSCNLIGCIACPPSIICNQEVAHEHGPHREKDSVARAAGARVARDQRRERVWQLVRSRLPTGRSRRGRV